MTTSRLLLGSALLAAAANLASAQVSLDFSASSQFNLTPTTGNFTASTGTTTQFTYSGTAGVGGGGGVSVSTDAGGVNYNHNTAYALSAGSTYTISTFFKTNAVVGTSANQVAGVGLVGTNVGEFGTGSIQSIGLTLRAPLTNGSAGNSSTLQLAVANNPGTNANILQSTSFTAATNNWYKLSVSITKTATADTFSVSGSVEDWGAAGTSFSSSVRSFSGQTVTNAGLYADADLFAGFFARQTGGNPIQIAAVDNFSVIPEPSSFAAIAGLGMLGFAASRRRRR